MVKSIFQEQVPEPQNSAQDSPGGGLVAGEEAVCGEAVGVEAVVGEALVGGALHEDALGAA